MEKGINNNVSFNYTVLYYVFKAFNDGDNP